MAKLFKIALAGNPNSGKSTIFNAITGSHQHVGNYPGVTVEKREGKKIHRGLELSFIDLPGTYSLSARSLEEKISRSFLVDEKPDLVINVIDTSHIERNLYLTTQMIELGSPVIIALNMYDISEANGHLIDIPKLSALLGIPIVKTIANKKEGISELLDKCSDFLESKIKIEPRSVNYGEEIEEEIARISSLIDEKSAILKRLTKKFVALKLLEKDPEITASLKADSVNPGLLFDQVTRSSDRIRKIYNEEPDILLVDKRYGFISGAHTDASKYITIEKHNYSDRIDAVLTHKLFGLPIFLGIMWILFSTTFRLGEPFIRLIESFFSYLHTAVTTFLPSGILRSALTDGVISGVGGVVSFVPNIMILFIFISILEDSGYMARAAFLMDNMMHRIGLHGKSFIPLLIGFGCSVPAIMATRTLESRRDRITTMMLVPFMSCSARLPVYTLLVGVFFPASYGGHVLFAIYLTGMLAAIGVAKVIQKMKFLGPSTPFVMELPPYLMPTLRGVLMHMWRRSWLYLKRAGTIILAISLALWFLSNFPSTSENPRERLENSFTGCIGKAITPVLKPIGLGNWKVGVSVVSGFTAREVVVSTLGTLYSMEGASEKSSALRSALRLDASFSPLTALVMMLFVLLSCPCMATFAIMKQETRGWRWPIFMAVYMTALAWVVCFIVFQLGNLLGIGTTPII